jgi:hypothetical protein
MPEILVFLNGALSLMTGERIAVFPTFTEGERQASCLQVTATGWMDEKLKPFHVLAIKALPLETTALKQQLLTATVKTALTVAKLWSSHEEAQEPASTVSKPSADALEDDIDVTAVYVAPSATSGTWAWTEVFSDTLQIMATFNTNHPLTAYAAEFQALADHIMVIRAKQSHRLGLVRRVPLQWQKKRAQAIRMATPKFEESYNPDRHYDPDPVRSEQRKLKAQHRQELKGAVRELKKDAAFLANEKIKTLKARDSDYNSKIKRVYGMLGNEHGEARAEMRKKRK